MSFLAIKWDPSLGIDLGFFVIRWYSLMFVSAFLIGAYLMKKMYKNDGISPEKVDPLFMYSFISMLIGMRLGEVFFYNWGYYQNNLLEIIIPAKKLADGSWKFTGFTGFASHGAAVAIPVALYFYTKNHLQKSWLFVLDRMGIVVALAGFFIRFGNFCNSEIYGKPTGSDFGVIFVADDLIPRHPTQLYEAFSYLILFFVLWHFYWKTDKKKKEGFLFGVFMVALWSLRFFIEFLKEAQIETREDWVFNSLNTGQVLSIPLVLIGFWLMFRKQKEVV